MRDSGAKKGTQEEFNAITEYLERNHKPNKFERIRMTVMPILGVLIVLCLAAFAVCEVILWLKE